MWHYTQEQLQSVLCVTYSGGSLLNQGIDIPVNPTKSLQEGFIWFGAPNRCNGVLSWQKWASLVSVLTTCTAQEHAWSRKDFVLVINQVRQRNRDKVDVRENLFHPDDFVVLFVCLEIIIYNQFQFALSHMYIFVGCIDKTHPVSQLSLQSWLKLAVHT